ncbi:sigma-70 family RNA polymerase sigma factor [Mariniphaga sediminis]|uniref:Sigma-70 family RNA polymerase sigma factor n=2 Tax=Mariniphaga sediminis TaxID=1628158 RepID=A0A399D1M7_9BACT|nr:sigma-70 family RNA polymerase sigma factor [Mariniphaga sediminis]
MSMSGSTKNDSYKDIWQKFIDGDREALSALYFDFFDVLLNFGMKYSSDRYLVEDCIQNIFVDLIRNKGNGKQINNIKFFLLKSIKNQILYQQRKTQKLIPVAESGTINFNITYSIEHTVISKDTEETRDRFLNMVKENLTNKQKEALYLRFNCGFEYAQISELMNISVESCRTLLYRTIKSLKEKFGNSEYSNLVFFMLMRSRNISFS